MSRKDPKGRTTIARVVAAQPPPWVRTIAQWLEWRAAEDKRMKAQLAAQLQAHAERDAGATEH
jgi:hypothetical protein